MSWTWGLCPRFLHFFCLVLRVFAENNEFMTWTIWRRRIRAVGRTQAMIEYTIIVAFVAIGLLVAVRNFSNASNRTYDDARKGIDRKPISKIR